MKDKVTKKRIILIFTAVVCLAVGIIFLIGQRCFAGKTQGIESGDIITGAQNGCIAYDAVTIF